MVAHFGQFTFDAETGVLTRNGLPVRLQPQPAKVLAVLVARAGEIVSRDELRQEIWGTETFVDFERGLNFCVAQIRSALGDSADSPRFIETLPKRGYRFIAPTSALRAPAGKPTSALPATAGKPTSALRATADNAETGAADPDREQRPTDMGQSRREGVGPLSRSGMAVAALLFIVIAASLAPLARRNASPPPIRVAVVPFDNETGDTEYDRIAGGVADATVSRLATPERMQSIAVIGNAAVLRRPRAFRDIKTIGQKLHAAYVLLAQVKSDEQRVRLIAHLIRVSDQTHVWSHTFDRDAFGLEVQAELAESIAQAVVANAK